MKPTSEKDQQFELLVVVIEFILVALCYLIVAHLDYLQATQ